VPISVLTDGPFVRWFWGCGRPGRVRWVRWVWGMRRLGRMRRLGGVRLGRLGVVVGLVGHTDLLGSPGYASRASNAIGEAVSYLYVIIASWPR